jgi:PhnB protein
MQLQPYLFFDGKGQDAIEFYKKAVNAEVLMLMRNKEAPPAPHGGTTLPPGSDNMILHATLKVGSSTFNLSDGHCKGRPIFQGFALSLTARDIPTSQKLFNALADGGTVQMPLTKTFFSPSFGMLSDRFGVQWMIYVAPDAA